MVSSYQLSADMSSVLTDSGSGTAGGRPLVHGGSCEAACGPLARFSSVPNTASRIAGWPICLR